MQKPIKVLIVEDSPSAAELLSYIINTDAQLQVIGIVDSGEKAVEFIQKHTPDIITMDIYLPKMNGFEATRQILKIKPIPIVIISSIYNKEDVKQGFRAVEAGALAILEKPRGFFDRHYKEYAQEITSKLKSISQVKLSVGQFLTKSGPNRFVNLLGQTAVSLSSELKIEAVGIGASLGGPQALYTLLSQLPAHFPVPIFVVQHISVGFTAGFAEWLKEGTSLKVKLAQDGETCLPGSVYIAPDQYHMEIKQKNIISLVDAVDDNNVKPSVNHLFQSMATTYGSRQIGILLTGMGKDGAEGLLALYRHGAMTIAQDQESCLMFSMPQQAISLGAARQILSLSAIAETLKRVSSNSK